MHGSERSWPGRSPVLLFALPTTDEWRQRRGAKEWCLDEKKRRTDVKRGGRASRWLTGRRWVLVPGVLPGEVDVDGVAVGSAYCSSDLGVDRQLGVFLVAQCRDNDVEGE